MRVPLLLFILLAACAPVPAAPTPTPTAAADGSQPVIVTLTFDDGNADNFPVAQLMQQNGLQGTFYIPSGMVGKPGFMTWDQLHTLQADGQEIGGHSYDHMKLGGLDTAALHHEICDDRQNLIDHGFTPVSFAYPFGNFEAPTEAMLKQCGYLGARTILGGPQHFPIADPYAVLALPYIVSDTNLAKLQRYISQARTEGGGWVILTFHHVCDGCDYFSVKPDVMDKYIPWLAGQRNMGHVTVKTFGEVMQGK